MNKVIHFKLPIDDKGNISIRMSSAAQIADSLRSILPKEYKCIFTPFDINWTHNCVTIKRNELESSEKIKDLFTEELINNMEDLGIKYEIID